jgi:hypothetical protein
VELALHSKFLGTRGVNQQQGEAGFMFLAVEQCLMPSPQGSFQGKVKKDGARADLKTYAPNDFLICGARLILQEKVILEHRKVRRNSSESFTKMEEDDNLENGIRVEMD